MTTLKITRKNQLAKWRTIINRDSYPRLEMFLLVSFTGMAGFLTSLSLLHFGFNTIWLRYLVSMGVAYAVFIGLLGIWLAWKTNRTTSGLDGLDDLSDFAIMSSNNNHGASFHGGGGSFDGGGASGDYDSGDSAGIVGEALGSVAQAEEAAIPLIVIGALIFGLLSVFIVTFSLVSSAPILFSELLVDGMLSASLYKRLKGVDSHHWLESAVKRTFWPFVFFTIIFVVVGWTMGHFMPGVHSLGEVLGHFMKH